MRRLLWLVAGLIVCSSSPAFAQSAAEKATAEALFENGKKLLEQGKYEEACPKFEASQKLDAGVGTLLFLGECYEKQGRLASAWATFREADSVARSRGDQERASIAKKRGAALEPRLSKLQIMVASENPPDLVVKQDGAVVPRESWDIMVPVDPGSHTIEASAAGKRTWSQSVTIGADGAQAKLDVPALQDAPQEAAPEAAGATPAVAPEPVSEKPIADESSGSAQRTVGIIVGVVGLAGVAVGSVFGLKAKSKNDDSKAECADADENRCTKKGFDLRERQERGDDLDGCIRRRRSSARYRHRADLDGALEQYRTSIRPSADARRFEPRRDCARRFLLMLRMFAKGIAVCAALATISCANVLGIEDAKVDPSLEGNGTDSGTQQMPTLCDRYCDTVMENCTEGNTVYTDRSVCMAICDTLPKGIAGAIDNSVQCRLRNAELAASTGEAGLHCPIAGPGGNGVCGSNCDGFCIEIQQICEGEFPSLTDCKTACEALPDLGHYDVSIQSGGTVQCRLYHVSAATLDFMRHCPHAGGASPCNQTLDAGQ